MVDEMGFRNMNAVYAKCQEGKLLKERGDKLSLNSMALSVLQYMAHSTYDWPPTDKIVKEELPCRYYTLGWRSIAESLGMVALSPKQLSYVQSQRQMDELLASRENTSRLRVTNAWKFLKQQGLIKQLVPASLGKNAGYLLLLGDNEENEKVEAWARQCLGLPLKQEDDE